MHCWRLGRRDDATTLSATMSPKDNPACTHAGALWKVYLVETHPHRLPCTVARGRARRCHLLSSSSRAHGSNQRGPGPRTDPATVALPSLLSQLRPRAVDPSRICYF
eukprot:5157010-Amphidinium_carterae.1